MPEIGTSLGPPRGINFFLATGIYMLLANSRFLHILNISSLMSYHTIIQDFMDSNNHFSQFRSYLGTFSPYISQCN